MKRSSGPRRKPHWVTTQFMKLFKTAGGGEPEELIRALDGMLGGSVHAPRPHQLAARRIKLDDGRVLDLVPAQNRLGGTGARGLLRLSVEGLLQARRSVLFTDPGEPAVCAVCGSKFDASVMAASSHVRQCRHRLGQGQSTCDRWSAVLCGDAGERVAVTITEAEARHIAGSGMCLADVLGFLARRPTEDDAEEWAHRYPGPRAPLSSAVLEVRRRSSSPSEGERSLVEIGMGREARAALERITAHCGGVQELQHPLEVLRRALR